MKLPTEFVQLLARSMADEALDMLERHIDAHPRRYARNPNEAAYDSLRERVEGELERIFTELEVPWS